MTWWTTVKKEAGRARRDALWRAVHWGWREFQRAGLVTADTPGGRAFRRFGHGSLMAFPPGSVFGEGSIEIGEGTLIGQQATLSAGTLPGQDLFGLTLLAIGDRCVIGRGSHIVAHQSVTIKTSRVVCAHLISEFSHVSRGVPSPHVPCGHGRQPIEAADGAAR